MAFLYGMLLSFGCGGSDIDKPVLKSKYSSEIKFKDVTEEAGLGEFKHENGAFGSKWFPESMGAGGGFIDFNNDGFEDILLVGGNHWSDKEDNIVSALALYKNDGDGKFSNVTTDVGLGGINAYGFGISVADYDNDDDLDIYFCQGSGLPGWDKDVILENKLYRNDGNKWTDVTSSAGVGDRSYSMGCACGDVDNDGYIDIFTNGNILLNNGDFTFSLYTAGTPGPGAIGDANSDGFVDVFNGANLYLNDGNANNWLKITTTGTTSNTNGIGARVEINSPGVGTQIRDVVSGSGFRYMSSLNTHFGIGSDSSVSSITVYWPSGTVDVIESPSINTTINITEGETLSLESSFIEGFIVYPNPTKNSLTIGSSLDLDQSVISVFDIAGRRVLNFKLTNNINSIDVSGLSAGEYILRVITKENGISSQKFIKQ